MNADVWPRVKELYQQALEQPAAERRAWLERAGAGDGGIVVQVQALLDATETLGGFLETPVVVPAEDVGAVAGLSSLQPGARIGAYEVVREIGRGGMGVVYLARDSRLGREVALKLLPPEASADPVNRERLKREAQAAATINHPAVATVFALEEIDGQLFIASEYVDGRSLREVIATQPLPEHRAMELGLEIADALHSAHAAGIVHRDLKPENVLLTKTGAVKLVDFGIAHVDDHEGPRLTRRGDLLGTPAYMAPEQLTGAPVDSRSDVYSVGLLLAEMVVGRHPLRDGGSMPALPPGIATIVSMCLQVDPSARYVSAAALRDALASARVGALAPTLSARRWWTIHQSVTAAVYILLLVPAWLVRQAAGGPTPLGLFGTWLFVAVLAAGVAAITFRLHLLFVSRSGTRAVEGQHVHSGRWLRAADLVFAAGLVVSGVLIQESQQALGVLLVSAGVVAAMAALVIEPATSRAAFDAATRH